jgi:hypothetical protein
MMYFGYRYSLEMTSQLKFRRILLLVLTIRES